MNKKKLLGIITISMFSVFIVTAALVTYLSNTVTTSIDVESPIEITVGGDLSLEMYGGESIDIDSTITNLANVNITEILTEVKVLDFDGIGITYHHSDGTWEGDIPVCTFGDDAYYYIGPATGFTLTAGESQTATSTITADQGLLPRIYESKIIAIDVSARMC